MSSQIRLRVNDIVGNHSLESLTKIAEEEKLLNDIEVEIKGQRNTPQVKEKRQTKIQRVPEIMLQYKNFNESSYYKPREVSIGPIHADSCNLSKRDLKIKLAARFVMGSGETGEVLLGKIKAEVKELRKCYDERVIRDYKDDRLSQLLFLDGCSLLQFVESYLSDSLKDFNITNGEAELISNDLLLAENQIPFLVLKLLIYSCNDEFQEKLKMKLLKFVARNVPIGYPNYNHRQLDFICSFWLRVFVDQNKSKGNQNNFLALIYAEDCVHLLALLRAMQIFCVVNRSRISKSHYYKIRIREGVSSLLSQNFGHKRANRNGDLYPRSFRNVQELKLAGIKLRPSGSCSLKDISFSTKCFISGQLELPAFVVDKSTAPKLLNLVAYEMCLHDYETNCTVTSYVNFLDLLIDNEQDVKDLRGAHILRNHLSSDAEVAQLINNIGYCCRKAPNDAYLNVKNEIQRHYERKTAIWMAQFYNDHVKSPWTLIALFAASIVLLLTAIQTWYTVNPKKN